jgi:hypothetical protein
MVVFRANTNVHVCNWNAPMNRMQAVAQGRKFRPTMIGQLVVEAVEAASAIPIDASGKEIEL